MRFRSLYTLAMASCLLLGVMPGHSSAAVPWQGFDDVPPSNIFYDDITWLHDEGITKGCNPPANALFCPEDSVTRGQMAAFLSRALHLPQPTRSNWFADDDGSVFEGEIDRLASAGITKGCNPPENTMFCPDELVTRAQMATFLARALELETGSGLDWFNDDDQSVHSADIDRLRAAWVTFGCNPPTENRFCPDDVVTRQQMAAFLHRGLTQPVQAAAIGVHGSTWPDPLYLYADMVATFEVRNNGTVPLMDVVAHPYPDGEGGWSGDCSPESVSGPVERLGNDDGVLDPGEIWDWYCGQPAYNLWESMYFEASGAPSAGPRVSDFDRVDYSVLSAVYATVTVSATSIQPGDEVTWTVVLHNPSSLDCASAYLGVRESGNGAHTYLEDPDLVLAGDGDALFEPGEQWQFEYTTRVWSDTYLEVTTHYSPDFSPAMTSTMFPSIVSDTVTVVTP